MKVDHLKPKCRPIKELFVLPKFGFNLFKQLSGEFLATFIFTFVIVGNSLTNLYNGNAFNFGVNNATNTIAAFLVVLGVTYSFGDLSGAHFNPVLTAGLMFAMKLNWIIGILYLAIQFLASFAAVGLLLAIFPVAESGSLGNSRAINLVVPLSITDAGYWFYQLLISIGVVFFYLFFIYDRRPAKIREDMSSKEKFYLREARSHYLTRLSLAPFFWACLYGGSQAYNTPWKELSVCLVAKQCGKAWIWNVAGFFGALLGAVLYLLIWGAGQPCYPSVMNPAFPILELEDPEDEEVTPAPAAAQ